MFAIISQQTPQQHKIYQRITRTAVGEIPVLDILVKRCPDNTFMTSIFRKKRSIRWTLYQVGLIHPKQILGSISSAPSPVIALEFEFALHLRCFNLLSAICKNSSSKFIPSRNNKVNHNINDI